jgi:hypothetical protein
MRGWLFDLLNDVIDKTEGDLEQDDPLSWCHWLEQCFEELS